MNVECWIQRVHRWTAGGLGGLGVLLCSAAWGNADLMGLYRDARAQDPQLEVARLQREAAQEKLPQARAGWQPVVQLVGNIGRQDGQSSFTGAPYEDRSVRNGALSLQFTQPLWRPAQSASLAQADALVRQADEQLRGAEQELVLRVAQAYVDTVVAQESLRVARALLDAVLLQLEVAQRNFEVGMTTITDVHESRSRYALAKAQWMAAQTDVDMRRAELERLSGRSNILALRRPHPQVDSKAFGHGVGEAVTSNVATSQKNTNHPQVKALMLAVEAAEQEVRKQQAAHGPVLDLTASYGHTSSSGSMTSPTEVLSRSRATQIGLQFNMPLYAGGVVVSRVREAILQQERAQAELVLLQGQLRMQEQQFSGAWLRSNEQIRSLALAVQASHALVQASQVGYRIGTRINMDVLNAEQQRAGAERDLFKACADAAMYRLRLKAAQGQLSANDLAQVDELLKVIQ